MREQMLAIVKRLLTQPAVAGGVDAAVGTLPDDALDLVGIGEHGADERLRIAVHADRHSITTDRV